jgi:hypothetical protein
MRVLFLIPKNNPPQLTGNFSKHFKEFVETCLNKEPENVSAGLSPCPPELSFNIGIGFQKDKFRITIRL